MGWIIIREIRWSTTSLVTDRRCQRKGAEEDESINQHNPSFEHRDRSTNADDPVQRKQHLPPTSDHESHGSNVSVKNKLIGPSTSAIIGSRRRATLRCGWMSGLTCAREATKGDVYADGRARDPSVRITRIEAIRGCSSRLLETSQVRRATAGSKVNLHEHACDAKWVVCHAAMMVVLDRESAQDGAVVQLSREKSLQV